MIRKREISMTKYIKLVNEDQNVVTVFEIEEISKSYISGTLKTVNSWDEENEYDCDFDYIAGVFIKWDGCSHFNFKGEDYNENKEETIDGYYHLCGVDMYIDLMRSLSFAYQIMVDQIGEDELYEKEEYQELKKLNLLDKYTIVYE
jgi:hypothetical protein